jgi:hypothetical protein
MKKSKKYEDKETIINRQYKMIRIANLKNLILSINK